MATYSNPELEARILANPNDLSSFLVYSDWLSERGDPRGELIAVQANLQEHPDDPALKATESKLFAEHGKGWLGELASKESIRDLVFTWRLGFIDSVRFGPPLDEYETSDLDFPEAVAILMKLPGISFIREIVVGSKSYDDYPTTWEDVIDAMAEHGVPRALRRLEFNCGGYWDISSTTLGDLSKLYPRLPHLQELKIRMGGMHFGAIDLPALRSLEIETGGLTAENVAEIAKASWPNLERLSLCIGESDNDYGCTVHLEDLTPILAGANLGTVRHLGLCNTDLADAIATELASSKILSQLESLDLSRGTFSDVGARSLLENAAAFKHLKVIDLTHSFITPEVGAELTKMGPQIILADVQDSGDDDYRYVQISE